MKEMLLVVTYHFLRKSLGAIINKKLSIFNIDKDVKKVFTLQSKASYLARAKLCPLDEPVGSYKCKSNQFQVWNNITEADLLLVKTKLTIK